MCWPQVLGSLVSVLIIWLVTGVLLYEAVLRVLHPEPVDGRLMFFLALAGIVVNLAVLFLFGHSHGHQGHSRAHGHGQEHDHGSHSHAAANGHSHGGACVHGSSPEEEEQPGQLPGIAPDAGTAPAALTDAAVGCSEGHGHAGHSHDSLGMRAAFIHAVGDTVQSMGVCIAGIVIW